MDKRPTYEELELRIKELEKKVVNHQQAEAMQRESELMYKLVVEGSEVGTWDRDIPTGNVIRNERAAQIYGYTLAEMKENYDWWESRIHPDDKPKVLECRERHIRGETDLFEAKYRLKHRLGEWIWVQSKGKIVKHDKNGQPLRISGILIDITEQKRTEEKLREHHQYLEQIVTDRTADLLAMNEKLKTSLKEKEILLREIHHRVKNNFEIISSFLDLSNRFTENQDVHNVCKDTEARIHSMALIHDQLYQNDRLDQIDMEKQIQNMLDHLTYIYAGNGKSITSVLEPSEVYLPLNQAIPCSMVVNELVANAYKHAFKGRRQGLIRISIDNPMSDTIQIIIKDDGNGFPENVDLNNTTGLGLKLVRHLVVGQLKGEVLSKIDQGTELQIKFKKAG